MREEARNSALGEGRRVIDRKLRDDIQSVIGWRVAAADEKVSVPKISHEILPVLT